MRTLTAGSPNPAPTPGTNMSTNLAIPTQHPTALPGRRPTAARAFCALALLLAVVAAFLAGWAPLGFSIVTVFLFAGPHNWIEARYFLARLPARWGKLRGFFVLSFAGIFGLTAAFATMSVLGSAWEGSRDLLLIAYGTWNTLHVLWIAALMHLRGRQAPRRDWSWSWSIAFALAALAWMAPALWGLGLVYLHPLIALWLLDR